MKKVTILVIGLLLFAGCDKDENKTDCSVCTVVTSNSSTGESTTTYTQSELGDCEESQSEFKEEMDAREDTNDALVLANNVMQGTSTTQTHTITCVYE